MATTTRKKAARKHRHIDWCNVIWALSQIWAFQIMVHLIKEVIRMGLDFDYAPSEKSIIICSLGLIMWFLVNPIDPINYLRAWIWDHQNKQ